jgi:hypothetical protein
MAGLLSGIMPGEWGQGGGGILDGSNPMFNMGLGILANNSGHYGALGPALGGGMQQGLQQTQLARQQAMQNKMYELKMEELKREKEQREKREQALPRLLQGESAYMKTQEVPVTSYENMPMPAAPGAMSPNFGLQRQETTSMQPQTAFDQSAYTQDLVNAGFGDDLIKAKFAPKEANYDIAPDGTMYDKKTGQVVTGQKFSKPASESLPSAVQEYEYAKEQGFKGSYLDFELAQKRAGASVNNVSVNTGQKGFDNVLKLRGDFRSEPIYKAHQDVKSAHAQISSSLKLASPAGDLAGATKLMKILDPGSVVRESELGMAMAASGALDRLTNYAQMVMSGNKLTPTQRKDFQTLSDALYAESSNLYNAKRGEYKGIADRNGLNELDVLGGEDKVPTKGSGRNKKDILKQYGVR